VEEAYEVLSLLFVERPAPPDILVPATDVAQEVLAATEAGTASTAVADWSSFSDVFCSMWTGRESEFQYDAVSYPSITAMTAALNEGHTNFLTPQMYSDHRAWQSGDVKYEGIGARLTGEPLTVQHVFPGSPAAEAGVEFGDHILAIDGEPAADMSVSEAVMLIRGEGGTYVNLRLERNGVSESWDVEIARGTIFIPTIESRMIDDIAYLRIDSFPTSELPREVLTELEGFRAAGAKGLVLDLRDNSGGRLDVGTQIASYFLPQDVPLYQQTTRRGQQTTRTSGSGRIWTAPIVVLINDGTASMGEILASALQEGDAATLIGTTTAGEVAGSIMVPLSDGSAVQVTTLRIDSGKGVILNRIGVRPNIELEAVPEDVRAGVDRQLQAALSHLRTQLSETPAQTQPSTSIAPR
jgi:carboxyl-terminal processing protease